MSHEPGPPLDGAIDVHAHFLTPRLRAAMHATGHDRPDGMPAIPEWDAARALAVMDRMGIRASVLSVSSPGVLLDGDIAAAVSLARAVNEDGADIVAAHPRRFGLFASLPLPDVGAAVTEATYAFDQLGVDGIALHTNYAGTYLGDTDLDPLMAVLDDRRAVVHIHPTSPACWEHTALQRPRPMLEFLFDTTRAVAALVLNDVPGRFPGIRFIVSHSGAALPVLADRIAAFALIDSPEHPVDVVGALRRLHYDVAGFAFPRAVPALLGLVAPEQLLYGSDYPFTPDWAVHGLATALAASTDLTDRQREQVTHLNATELLPRFATAPPG